MKIKGFMLVARNLTVLLLSSLLITTGLFAQDPSLKKLGDYGIFEGNHLSASFHASRREALRDTMPQNTVAVFFAAPERYRSYDIKFDYHQETNFFYLTGLREPHAMLVVFKHEHTINGVRTNEVLILPKADKREEQWEGQRLGLAGAKEVLGFSTVFASDSFPDWEVDFSKFNQIYVMEPVPGAVDNPRNRGDLASLYKHFKIKVRGLEDKVNVPQLEYWLAAMREVKQPQELVLIRRATGITCRGLNELMRALEPGLKEYQAEAIIEFWFKNMGGESPGFPSIVAGGKNACYLHYSSNRQKLKGEHLLLCDVGAEYHGYTADITRTMPVDGKFSADEKALYEVVLAAQNAGIAKCQVGNKFWDADQAAKAELAAGLKRLGIISRSSELKKYFFHGTSHYMGLDVHDSGLKGFLKPGNVITVEPGIYISEGSDCDPKWWNMGIRIEDDILITDNGPENLSAAAPRTVAEIEALMATESLFNVLNDQ